jgi:predicted nucleic acid-binding Zn ribbon protein
MPTYVYKFIDSGETIEVYQAFTDDPLTELAHPQDGVVKPVKKVFTPVGVSFKGGGFYKTDSKSTQAAQPLHQLRQPAPQPQRHLRARLLRQQQHLLQRLQHQQAHPLRNTV